MKMIKAFGIAVLAAGLAASSMAVDSKKSKKGAAVPEMDAQMEQAMKLGMPNENHKVLEPLVGQFNVTVLGWMKPGDKPMESKGTATHQWIYGGRYLKQDFKGDWAGQPYEGMGFTGYDNVRGEYISSWMDNMSTSVMNAIGSYDPATKTLKTGGTYSCSMTSDKDRWFRSEWKIDADKSVYTSYYRDDQGREFKSMEITYARVK